jgi:site-specific recombinase XerD
MKHYEQEINLYFELKGTPDSSRESYLRRIYAFINFMQGRHKCMEDITESDIQQYILFLKREKGLSAGTVNNYISAIKFFHTHVLGKEWNSKKIPQMKRMRKFPVIPPKQDVPALLNTAILLCVTIHAGTGTAPCARVSPGPFGLTKGAKISSTPLTSMWCLPYPSSCTH